MGTLGLMLDWDCAYGAKSPCGPLFSPTNLFLPYLVCKKNVCHRPRSDRQRLAHHALPRRQGQGPPVTFLVHLHLRVWRLVSPAGSVTVPPRASGARRAWPSTNLQPRLGPAHPIRPRTGQTQPCCRSPTKVTGFETPQAHCKAATPKHPEYSFSTPFIATFHLYPHSPASFIPLPILIDSFPVPCAANCRHMQR